MARKQLEIVGTERKRDEEVEAVAEELRDLNSEFASISNKKKTKTFELIALLRSKKMKRYKYDDEHGEEILVSLDDQDPKLSVKKTGEAEPHVGEGVPSGEGAAPAGMQGLIAEATKAQDEANVEETDDGDVAVPDKAAPKAKRGKGKKRS